jgi:hypothetical protein
MKIGGRVPKGCRLFTSVAIASAITATSVVVVIVFILFAHAQFTH